MHPHSSPCCAANAVQPRSRGAIVGARISAVNYAEVVSHFVQLGMPEREVAAMLDPLPMTVVPLDKALAELAGRMRAVTAEAGLSLGGRTCLALALRDDLPAWTSDLSWKTIASVAGVKVVAIR